MPADSCMNQRGRLHGETLFGESSHTLLPCMPEQIMLRPRERNTRARTLLNDISRVWQVPKDNGDMEQEQNQQFLPAPTLRPP